MSKFTVPISFVGKAAPTKLMGTYVRLAVSTKTVGMTVILAVPTKLVVIHVFTRIYKPLNSDDVAFSVDERNSELDARKDRQVHPFIETQERTTLL